MEKGYLIINVYADTIGQPINNADVEIIGNNVHLQLKTDISGKTEQIELDAPNKEYSLSPQKEVKPYAQYSIKVTQEGMESTIIDGVEIFTGEIALQNVFLTTEPNTKAPYNYYEIPDHTLWGNYPPKIKESFIKEEGVSLDSRVLPTVLVPEFIIVHDGIPTNNNVANYTVNFIDYIKNVACSELYSTWPIETIKANVLAILSFTLNRIYTEWYTSKGYNFTITSSTAYDQKYSHGRTIFKSIADVVDSIFQQYIKLPNVKQPLFAQYNDGIVTNNAGWLSQWGSKDLGDKGYMALDILKYYYTNNIIIAEAEEIDGLPTSYPGYSMALGDCGEPIQKIQNELNVINGSYSGIPKIIPADGQFKQNTETTVRAFQKAFDIPVTGIIDFTTWYRISYIYTAVSKMIEGIYQ
ncbi:MAG: peptidoglycan-binding protein [Coprobacillaceae bacterium]